MLLPGACGSVPPAPAITRRAPRFNHSIACHLTHPGCSGPASSASFHFYLHNGLRGSCALRLAFREGHSGPQDRQERRAQHSTHCAPPIKSVRSFREPNSQVASWPAVFLFFSTTFLVRLAQDFERFEQGCPQRPILPSRLFDNHLEQPALLGGGLLQEQLACPARQAQHVDGLIDWGRRGILDILDLAL